MQTRNILTQISRVLVGLLFIFSGFIKANDPLGFAYKLDEYFAIFRMSFLEPYTVGIAILICIFEIFLGICLLLGVCRLFTVWMLLLMIVFFTFLTFYSAWFNKVTDCGCFGDFLKLTPWTSFWKDIVLLVLILILFINRKLITPLFNPKAARTTAWVLLIPTIIFPLYSWYYLPLLDFRPYAIGKDLKKQMETPPGAPANNDTYIYKNLKTGENTEVSYDELMAGKVNDETQWEWVETKSNPVPDKYRPKIIGLVISKGGADVTEQFLSEPGYRLLIVHYNIEKSKASVQDKLNELATELQQDGKVKIWPLSGSSEQMNQWYIQTYKVPYTYYFVDNIPLKTMVRSNPGLILLKDNLVLDMWPATALPGKDDIYAHMK